MYVRRWVCTCSPITSSGSWISWVLRPGERPVGLVDPSLFFYLDRCMRFEASVERKYKRLGEDLYNTGKIIKIRLLTIRVTELLHSLGSKPTLTSNFSTSASSKAVAHCNFLRGSFILVADNRVCPYLYFSRRNMLKIQYIRPFSGTRVTLAANSRKTQPRR